jgi:transketolase
MGAYTLCSHGTGASPNLVIASTGTEVQLAVSVAEALAAAGSTVRVVSMPCWELFDRQSIEYQREVTSFPSLPFPLKLILC